MVLDRPAYEAFLPHHTASKHRVMAVTRHPGHTQLHALATVPDVVTARRLADALNSRLLGRRNHAERLATAISGLPDSVQAAVKQLPINPDHAGLGRTPLAGHLYTDPIDGFLLLPTSACAPGRCTQCTDCDNDCDNCAVCDTGLCEECIPPNLTPRTAQALAVAGSILADHCYDAATSRTPLIAADDWEFLPLPDIMRGQGSEFIRRMARTFDDLAADLADGEEPRPRTMAEQVALHLIIDHADTLHTDQPELLEAFNHDLPTSSYDYDFGVLYDVLFEDADHIGLLDAVRPSDIPAAAGSLDHLFEPFNPDDDRDPDRGYRR